MDMESLFKVPYLAVGAIGGAISIIFGENKPKTLRQWIKSTSFVLSGAIITNFVTPLIMHLMPKFADFEYSIAFIFGLLGIGIVKAIFNVIKKLNNDPFGTLKDIKNIFKP